MSKNIILTEDSATGFDFYELLKNSGILRHTEVYSTGFSGTSRRGTSGGYSKCYVAFVNMIKHKVIQKGDTVLLAIDTLYPLTDEMCNDLKECNKQIQNILKLGKCKGIKCERLSFDCWESLILSFKYLVAVCNSVEKIDQRIITIYTKLEESGIFNDKCVDRVRTYSNVFKTKLAKGKTIEACLAYLLNTITRSDDKIFSMSKTGTIGKCWQHDCVNINNIDRSKCSMCYFVSPQNKIFNGTLHTGRLSFLVNNSLMSKLFVDCL